MNFEKSKNVFIWNGVSIGVDACTPPHLPPHMVVATPKILPSGEQTMILDIETSYDPRWLDAFLSPIPHARDLFR